jgi:ABC-2 type transport system permease protein
VRRNLVVAWWEYSEKIRSKAFIISLVLLPAMVTGLVVIPALFTARSETVPRRLGVIDETGLYEDEFASLLEERFALPDGTPSFHPVVLRAGPAGDILPVMLRADSMLLGDRLDGYFIIRSPVGTLVDVEFRASTGGNVRLQERIAPVLREAVTAVKLRRSGIDPALVAGFGKSVRIRTFKISDGELFQETAFEHTFFSVYLYMMMLFFIIITTGQMLVRSMLEEKSNRIAELLLSSVSPGDLMAGKILGLGGLGLTQMFLWGSFAFIVSRAAGLPIIPLGSALLLGVYFVLGYLLYAAIFVTAGAPLSTEQEAQQVTSVFSLGLVLPLGLAIPVMQDPGSTFSTILTMIPFFTPMMMAIRIPLSMPSLAEIMVSLALLGGSVYFTMIMAGRVFSASVLLAGKRLSIREVGRLIRTG